MLAGEADEQPDNPLSDLAWEPTDWTVWQRQRAVVGFFLVAASCGLLAGALAEWGTVWLAPVVIAPVAMTLLCLGIGLVDWVYWYPYQHAGLRPGLVTIHTERMASVMKLAVALTVWTFGAQLALAPWVGSADWRGFSTVAYLIPCMMAFLASGGTLAFVNTLGRTPTRAANTSGDGWTPSPRGVRLLLRWLGVMAATRGGILYLAPMMLLVYGDIGLTVGSTEPFAPPVTFPYLILIAVFFALITLSELSCWAAARPRTLG